MVSSLVEVISKKYDSSLAYIWSSTGVDGYTINPIDEDLNGTKLILHLKENTDTMNYDELLDSYKLVSIIKKYSDYIKYPIKMNIKNDEGKDEVQTINSMIPIWKKKQKDVKEEEYNDFYTDKFYDYENL